MDVETYRTIARAVHKATHAEPEARNGFSYSEHEGGCNGHPAYLAVLEHLLPKVDAREHVKMNAVYMERLGRHTIPAGTTIHLRGFPFMLADETEVRGESSNFSAATLERKVA